MSRLRRIQIAVVTVAAALAVGLFLIVVPITFSNTGPLAATIIGSTGLSVFPAVPSFSGSLPPSELLLPTMAQAGITDAVHTGAWAKQWAPTKTGSSDSFQIQTDVAPTVAIAKQVQVEAGARQLTKTVIAEAKHTYVGTFSIAPLDGSGSNYIIPAIKPKKAAASSITTGAPPAKTIPAAPGNEIVFRVGRTVVQEGFSGSASNDARAIAIAKREAALVAAVVPTLPPLQIRHNPIVSSVIFIVLALVAIVGLSFVPVGVDAALRRRVAERIARADRHRRVRGAKALKSHRRRF